jgi:outer membrane protein assembly factor BamB
VSPCYTEQIAAASLSGAALLETIIAMTTDSPYTSPTDPSPTSAAAPAPVPKPRLWPAVALVAAFWIVFAFVTFFGAATLSPFVQFLSLFYAPLVLALGIIVWSLFFSRLPWPSRLAFLGLIISGGVGAALLAHPSMAMGMMMSAMPVGITAAVLTFVFVYAAQPQFRWTALAAATFLAWGYFTLVRFDGVTGNFTGQRSWRWSPTAEDKYLAERGTKPGEGLDAVDAAEELVATASDWPEFRGPNRDSHLHNVSLTTDWTTKPPRELWRRRVGPGWSSFAVVGNRAFTQEQRGEREAVVCIDMATGDEIWSHEDKTRFYDVVAGAGPRAQASHQ